MAVIERVRAYRASGRSIKEREKRRPHLAQPLKYPPSEKEPGNLRIEGAAAGTKEPRNGEKERRGPREDGKEEGARERRRRLWMVCI